MTVVGRRRHIPRRDPGAQRSSRLNELLREIIADELGRIDDERLDWVSITSVKTDRSLDRAEVFFTAALDDEADEEALVSVFNEHRSRLQRAIGRQATLRRTPPLVFTPDAQVRQAERIEAILREVGDEPPPGDA